MDNWFKIIVDPEVYINLEIGGYAIGIYFLIFLAFAEAALFAGLFYSSDSFLFLAGVYSNLLINQLIPVESENAGVLILAGLIAAASIIGNILAYSYGAKAANYFENKKDGLLYKRKYLDKSKNFFQKYGAWAVISAHYIPLVRTFIPILAAISGMKFPRFAVLVSISSTLWSFSFILLGHYLYRFLWTYYHFDLKEHLWVMILVLLVLAVIFIIVKFASNKLRASIR